MERLIECVPNVSEGSDAQTLDAIESAVAGRPGSWLLDRTSDPDHERSVYTVVGPPDAAVGAMSALASVAIERIDMRLQRGQHPRIGAVDVIPFIPLGETSMDECITLAREFAEQVANRFALPIYLYAAAALRDDRRTLAAIRRPGFEGLSAAMRGEAGGPDLGPARPHPTAGAVAIGARPLLIAFNIQLATSEVAVARRIAGRIRERDGGLPAVQAIGLELLSQGLVQLSMNLLDHQRTPLWRVWETAARMAADEGTGLLDSELIGLAPTAALLDVADHIGVPASRGQEDRVCQAGEWLRIRDFDAGMALEIRLAAARGA